MNHDLGMRRVAGQFAPKLLSREQEELRRDVAQDMESTQDISDLLKTVINGDVYLMCGYDPERRKPKHTRRNGKFQDLQCQRK